MTVPTRAEVALRIERLAAERARRPSGGEDPDRAGDEPASLGRRDTHPQEVRPVLALYAAAVYVVVLTIEAYVSQPLLQRWAVSLPAIFNLLAILVFAPLFGIWGAILATPLAVALWVVIQMVYVEDVLDDRKHSPSSG